MTDETAHTPTPSLNLDALVATYKADPAMTPLKWVQWACDCAERVLNRYETCYPDDTHPRKAIAAARRWAANSVKDNANAAAYAAAYAARATHAAAYAANAADAAADADECLWQVARLMEIYHEQDQAERAPLG